MQLNWSEEIKKKCIKKERRFKVFLCNLIEYVQKAKSDCRKNKWKGFNWGCIQFMEMIDELLHVSIIPFKISFSCCNGSTQWWMCITQTVLLRTQKALKLIELIFRCKSASDSWKSTQITYAVNGNGNI